VLIYEKTTRALLAVQTEKRRGNEVDQINVFWERHQELTPLSR
jgi:hypothetical protein